MAKTASYMRAYRARKKAQAVRVPTKEESFAKLKAIGVHIEDAEIAIAERMDDRFISEMADTFVSLENQYGTIANLGGIELTFDTFTADWATSLDGRVLVVGLNKDYDKTNEMVKNRVEEGWFVETNLTGVQQLATHEYGHLHQFQILNARGENNIIGAMMDEAAISGEHSKILGTNLKGHGMSTYAREHPNEYYAEAFTAANGGANSKFGQAFNAYLANGGR